MTKVYFIRHAEAAGNIEGRFQGHYDSELTKSGYAQLDRLAERFRNVSFDKIYCSPLKRTRLTAEAANRFHGAKIECDERIIEIDCGNWENKSFAELNEEYPGFRELFDDETYKFKADGGESAEQVYNRMIAAVTDIVSRNAGKTLVIVSHGMALRTYICSIKTHELSRIGELSWLGNTAVTYVEYDDELNAEIKYFNDTSHLEG